MKICQTRFKAFLFLALFSSGTIASQVQMKKWFLKNHEIDFSTPIPTASPQAQSFGQYGIGGTTSSQDEFEVGNAIHDANGEKLISVYKNQVYCQNGLNFNLPDFNLNSTFPIDDCDYGVDIIPKPGSPCEFYIVYSFSRQVLNANISSYCADNTHSSLLYIEVNLAANNGQGSYSQTSTPLLPCQSYRGITRAYGKQSANQRYLYTFSTGVVNNVMYGKLNKFIVTTNGITFSNTVYESTALSNASPTELELSHDGSMLSMTSGSEVLLIHLNPSTGNLNPSAGNNNDGTSTFTIPNASLLTGIEFSPQGNNLFVGSSGQGIFSIDVVNGQVNLDPFPNSPDFSNSMLELAFHPNENYKIYAVHNNGTQLGAIINPNSTFPIFDESAIPNISTYGNSFASPMYVRHLPRQIDGQDYTSYFSNSGDPHFPIELKAECCAFLNETDVVNYAAPSNMTWTSSSNPFSNQDVVHVSEEIRIPAGKHVIINNMTFKFRENAKFVIEPTARVTLINSTLTSYDCDLMWQGVELQGTQNAPQQYSNQGWLSMHNSEISNAIVGIAVYSRNASNNIQWWTFGGVIQATASRFRNNIKSVEFLEYVRPNISFFSDCLFTTDAAINNGTYPLTHVTMFKTNGVRFLGCDFNNTTQGLYENHYRGSGIQSIDATFTVTQRCSSQSTSGCLAWERSTFEGLNRAVDAVATNQAPKVDIRFTDFSLNGRAVYLGGYTDAIIVENKFSVEDPQNWNPGFSYGLYLEQCGKYTVENNEFYNDFDGNSYGSLVNNSNTGPNFQLGNQIYNNYYENFFLAAGSINSNAYLSPIFPTWPLAGLVHRCNKFEKTSGADIFNFGTVAHQGGCTTNNFSSPANNSFSPDLPIMDYYNLSNLSLIYWYSPSSTAITQPRPGLYLANNTFPIACSPITYDEAKSCPRRNYSGKKTSSWRTKSEIDSNYYAAQDLFELIDGGSTIGLEHVILSNVENELISAMNAASPYVSEGMLNLLIENQENYTDSVIYTVLNMNTPLTPGTLYALQESALPNWVKNSFVLDEDSNPFAQLVSQMAYYTDVAYDRIFETVSMIHADSTIINPSSTIQTFLDSLDIDIVHDLKVSYAMYYNEFALADSLMLTASQRDSNDGFYVLQDLIIDLYENELNISSVWGDTSAYASSVINVLENLPYDFTATLIEKISSIKTDSSYLEEIPSFGLTRMMQISHTSQQNEKDVSLFFPNPVLEDLNIALEFEYGEKALCEIYAVSGKIAKKETIVFRKTKVNLSDLESGVYVVKIILHDGSIQLGKIVKQ